MSVKAWHSLFATQISPSNSLCCTTIALFVAGEVDGVLDLLVEAVGVGGAAASARDSPASSMHIASSLLAGKHALSSLSAAFCHLCEESCNQVGLDPSINVRLVLALLDQPLNWVFASRSLTHLLQMEQRLQPLIRFVISSTLTLPIQPPMGILQQQQQQ